MPPSQRSPNPLLVYYQTKYGIESEAKREERLRLYQEYSPREIEADMAKVLAEKAAIQQRIILDKGEVTKLANANIIQQRSLDLQIAQAKDRMRQAKTRDEREQARFEYQVLSQGRNTTADPSVLPSKYLTRAGTNNSINHRAAELMDRAPAAITDAELANINIKTAATDALSAMQSNTSGKSMNARSVGALHYALGEYGQIARRHPRLKDTIIEAFQNHWSPGVWGYNRNATMLNDDNRDRFIEDTINSIVSNLERPSIYTESDLKEGQIELEGVQNLETYKGTRMPESDMGLKDYEGITLEEAKELQKPWDYWFRELQIKLSASKELHNLPSHGKKSPFLERLEKRNEERKKQDEQAQKKEERDERVEKRKAAKEAKGKTPTPAPTTTTTPAATADEDLNLAEQQQAEAETGSATIVQPAEEETAKGVDAAEVVDEEVVDEEVDQETAALDAIGEPEEELTPRQEKKALRRISQQAKREERKQNKKNKKTPPPVTTVTTPVIKPADEDQALDSLEDDEVTDIEAGTGLGPGYRYSKKDGVWKYQLVDETDETKWTPVGPAGLKNIEAHLNPPEATTPARTEEPQAKNKRPIGGGGKLNVPWASDKDAAEAFGIPVEDLPAFLAWVNTSEFRNQTPTAQGRAFRIYQGQV